MAKKATSKKTIWYKDKVLWSGVAVFVVVVGGWYYHDSHSGKASKKDFENAQASIDKVYADIVAKLGPPSNYKKSQSCSRPSQKFSQGPLSCSVDLEFLHSVGSLSEANSKYSSIYTSLKDYTEGVTVVDKPDISLIRTSVGSEIWTSAVTQFKDNKSGMSCSLKTVYDTPHETYLDTTSIPNESKALYTIIGCSSLSRNEYFHLTN